MIDGLAPLNPYIERHRAAYEAESEALQTVIREEQERCPHLQILHAGGRPEYGALPLRMCVCCRLEEEGSAYTTSPGAWYRPGLGKPVLGNSPARLVVPCKRDEIYALRLPGPRHLANKETEEE